MDEKRLYRLLKAINAVTGAYRGIYQVPFHLGLIILLIKVLKVEPTDAFQLVIFRVFAMPRLLSLPLEYLTGWIGQRKGTLGSFSLLAPGMLLRALSTALFGLACVSAYALHWEQSSIIKLAIVAFLIGELGRALASGSLEDATLRTAERIAETDGGTDGALVKKIIAHSETLGKKSIETTKVFVTFVGSFAVCLPAFYGTGWEIVSLTALPFVVVALMHLYAAIKCAVWNNWAHQHLIDSRQKKLRGNTWLQTRVFLARGDWVWSLAFGLLTYQLFTLVNLAALSNPAFCDALGAAMPNKIWLLVVPLVSISAPLSTVLGTIFIFPGGPEKKDLKLRRLLWLDTAWGPILIIVWAIVAAFPVVFLRGESNVLIAIIPVVIVFAMIAGPLFVWANWIKFQLVGEAKRDPDHARNLSLSNVWYFSLIEGTRETGIALIGLLVPALPSLVGLDLDKSLSAFAAPIVMIPLLICWFVWRKLNSQAERDHILLESLK